MSSMPELVWYIRAQSWLPSSSRGKPRAAGNPVLPDVEEGPVICWEEGSLLSPFPAHQQTQHSHLWKHPEASPFSPASLPAWSRHHCGQDILPTPGRLPCTCLTPLRSFSTWQPERSVRASQVEVRGVFSRPPSASTLRCGSQVPAVPVWAITSLMQLQPPSLLPSNPPVGRCTGPPFFCGILCSSSCRGAPPFSSLC